MGWSHTTSPELPAASTPSKTSPPTEDFSPSAEDIAAATSSTLSIISDGETLGSCMIIVKVSVARNQEKHEVT